MFLTFWNKKIKKFGFFLGVFLNILTPDAKMAEHMVSETFGELFLTEPQLQLDWLSQSADHSSLARTGMTLDGACPQMSAGPLAL